MELAKPLQIVSCTQDTSGDGEPMTTIVHDPSHPQTFGMNPCSNDQHEWSEWYEPAFMCGYLQRTCLRDGCDAHEVEPVGDLRKEAKRD